MFFSGFAGEFGRQLQQSRAEEADKAERSNQLESGILEHLSHSADPEIAAHGITGLLDLANPATRNKRASGLQGFLGKMATHPALPTISQLISQGRQVPVETPGHLPSLQSEGGIQEGAPVGQPSQLEAPGGLKTPAAAPAAPGGTTASRSAVGRPNPDEGAERVPGQPAGPLAATPPPSQAPFAAGDDFQAPGTKMVTQPRHVFYNPREQAEMTATGQRTGTLQADVSMLRGTPGQPGLSPTESARIFGHVPAFQRTSDADGTVHFYQNGQEVSQVEGGAKPQLQPRPSGPEAQALERSREIQAANPPLTADQALAQARTEHRTTTVTAAADAHLVRLGQIQAMVPATIARWQQVNGTRPMTEVQARTAATQALSAARQTLGGGPDVTPEDITTMAKGLLAQTSGRRGPTVSPTRAALTQPLGGAAAAPGAPSAATPPPGGAAPDLTSTIPEHLRGASVKPRPYSAQGKQTIQALSTVEPMLTKLTAAIKSAGLENDNSVIGETFNKALYNMGISPGGIEEQRLQLTGMARAYRMPGLIAGPSNQTPQKLFGHP